MTVEDDRKLNLQARRIKVVDTRANPCGGILREGWGKGRRSLGVKYLMYLVFSS